MAANLADDIFKWIFLNENCCISIKISLKYIGKGPVDNNPTLVQIMAWHWTGNKPLSEPMTALFDDVYVSLCLNELNSAVAGSIVVWFKINVC